MSRVGRRARLEEAQLYQPFRNLLSDIASQYQHLAARRGKKKAIVAVAHSILRIVWHLLDHDCDYVDLGSRFLEERDRQRIERRLVRRLEGFGYTVKLEPAA